MPFDPKLKECAEEIKAVLDKYDVSASMSLVSKTHGEFVIHLPTWSGVQNEENGVRIKFTKEEKEKAGHTAQLIVSHMQVMEMLLQNFTAIFDALRSKSLISFSALENRITPHLPGMLKKKD